jgi:hypothetical protein
VVRGSGLATPLKSPPYPFRKGERPNTIPRVQALVFNAFSAFRRDW